MDYTREHVALRTLTLADGAVDAIADLAGCTLASGALPALRHGGQIAAIATPLLDLDPLLDANITFHDVLIGDEGDRTRALAALLDRRALQRVLMPGSACSPHPGIATWWPICEVNGPIAGL